MCGYDLASIAITAAIVIFFIGGDRIHAARRLRRWVEEAELTIVSKQSRMFRRGPYTWNSERADDVSLVVVRDVKGRSSEVWARFVSFPFGLWNRKFETSWTAKPATAGSPLD